jgi:hypothetical protein
MEMIENPIANELMDTYTVNEFSRLKAFINQKHVKEIVMKHWLGEVHVDVTVEESTEPMSLLFLNTVPVFDCCLNARKIDYLEAFGFDGTSFWDLLHTKQISRLKVIFPTYFSSANSFVSFCDAFKNSEKCFKYLKSLDIENLSWLAHDKDYFALTEFLCSKNQFLRKLHVCIGCFSFKEPFEPSMWRRLEKNTHLIYCSGDVNTNRFVKLLSEVGKRNLSVSHRVRRVVSQILIARSNINKGSLNFSKKSCLFLKVAKDLLVMILKDVWNSRFDHSFWLK